MFRVVDDIEMIAYSFKRFGKNFPKSVNISPDSFIQMAFQLAFYRIHKAGRWSYRMEKMFSVPPTYETATLRKFDEGRTENIRSPNTLAEAFVKKMSRGDVSVAELYESLKAAADSHKKYTVILFSLAWNKIQVNCMNGAGMDRHILAWRLIASENKLPVPSIAQTNVYKQMTHFQVSTSQATRFICREKTVLRFQQNISSKCALAPQHQIVMEFAIILRKKNFTLPFQLSAIRVQPAQKGKLV